MVTLTPTNFVAPLCFLAVISFGILAIFLYKKAVSNNELVFTPEFFLTARNTQPWYRVAWGFYACTIGAGVIFSVPSFVTNKEFGGGVVGLFTYSFFSGFPFLIIAYAGTYIKKRFPKVLSIGSYAKWRFGTVFQTWVTINVLFNLGIALSVEYTAIGSLAVDYLGIQRWVPIVLVGLVTMLYTAVGGLYIALITDQFQSIFILLMLFFTGIWVAINFRVGPLPDLPDYLKPNYVGWSSFVTLGVALISSTMFSDAVWQRVWAAKDKKALYIGASAGFLLASSITFLFGFGAFMTSWAGLVSDPNTAFFELLKVGEGDQRAVPIGMLLLMMIIACVMNESATDSFQIAIGNTVVSLFLTNGYELTLTQSRLILLCLNVPFALIGLLGANVVGLYLITNLMTTCLMLPLIFGLIPAFDHLISEAAVLFGSITALLSIVVYGIQQQYSTIDNPMDFFFEDLLDNIFTALKTTFYDVYDWPPFIIGLAVSIGATLLFSVIQKKLGLLPPLPAHLQKEPEYMESPSTTTLE
jgi:Na+/proline symporter